MPVSDAIVVGEDWISEHYFTTDTQSESLGGEVLTRRKAWDASATETARERVTAARGELERTFAALLPNDTAEPADPEARARVEQLLDRLLAVLGYRTGEFVLATTGPVTYAAAPGLTGAAPLAIVHTLPARTVEDAPGRDPGAHPKPVSIHDGEEIPNAARFASVLFVRDEPAAYILIFAGRWAIAAEAERWPEGRYLAIDLLVVAERNDTTRGDAIDRALEVGPAWNAATSLPRALDRRKALVEIDAFVALMLDVPINDLCTIFRTQFAVLYVCDHNECTFDADGGLAPTRVVQAWRKKGGSHAEPDLGLAHETFHDLMSSHHIQSPPSRWGS